MDSVLTVRGATKRYSRKAHSHKSYGLRDLYSEISGRRRGPMLRVDEFLAVDDLSFALAEGESLALIGRNGAGKTTMLKLIAGLVKLDGGSIEHQGSIQALINLGAGFNPNLSGRDNVLNAAALRGMERVEILQAVDEIVDFAELEDFIDSPFGTYSAGMKARLGFSTAVHLKPDILLVDEILSVGDHAFRQKSFGRMKELKEAGVSIVLVSHSHAAVVEMCERAIWISDGKEKLSGASKPTVDAYLQSLQDASREAELESLQQETARTIEEKEAGGSLYGPMYDDLDFVDDLEVILSSGGTAVSAIPVNAPLCIDYRFCLKKRVDDLNVTLVFYKETGRPVVAISTLNGDLLVERHDGEVRCRVDIEAFNLTPGRFALVMPIHEGKSYLYRGVVAELEVVGDGRPYLGLLDFQATAIARFEDAGEQQTELEARLGLDDSSLSSNSLHVRGWALASRAVTRVSIILDGVRVGDVRCVLSRPDVARRFSEYGVERCGFEFSASRVGTEAGPHTLAVEAYAGDSIVAGSSQSLACTIDTGLPAKLGISEARLRGQDLVVRGWALSSSPVTRVEVMIGDTVVGSASYGLPRADVHEQFAEYKNTHAGFELSAKLPCAGDELQVRAFSGEQMLAESHRKITVEAN